MIFQLIRYSFIIVIESRFKIHFTLFIRKVVLIGLTFLIMRNLQKDSFFFKILVFVNPREKIFTSKYFSFLSQIDSQIFQGFPKLSERDRIFLYFFNPTYSFEAFKRKILRKNVSQTLVVVLFMLVTRVISIFCT